MANYSSFRLPDFETSG